MKDRVYVSIKGLQFAVDENASDDEAIEVINVGKYGIIAGKEYVKYDELFEGESKKCTNIIKIDKNRVEVTKKGIVSTHMAFEAGEKTMTCYETPFGNMYLGIFTRELDIIHEEDEININIDYSLELNYEMISDCKLEMVIKSKGEIKLD